jgi:hypothetical protein
MAYRPTAYKKIFSKILAPLIMMIQAGSNEHKSAESVLDYLFDAENRMCFFAKVKTAFKMPGRPWDSLDFPHSTVHVTNKREVTVGSQLVVRLDKRSVDNYCEVEYNKTVFILTKVQWLTIKPRVDMVG